MRTLFIGIVRAGVPMYVCVYVYACAHVCMYFTMLSMEMFANFHIFYLFTFLHLYIICH